jgi:hypothetical protein
VENSVKIKIKIKNKNKNIINSKSLMVNGEM